MKDYRRQGERLRDPDPRGSKQWLSGEDLLAKYGGVTAEALVESALKEVPLWRAGIR